MNQPLREQLADNVLGKVWAKVSRAIQFRFGLNKGLFYISEHGHKDANGNLYDFVFPSGATKGLVERDGWVKPYDIELCINNLASTEERYWGNLNYQFINALDVEFADLKVLADRAYDQISGALNSPEDAIRFIGMIDHGDEADFEELTLATKLRELLSAHPNAYRGKWVQNQLKRLMKETLDKMKKGRIPLHDSRFAFIIADPTVLLKKNYDGTNKKALLKAGEYYYNGREGNFVILRSPLLDRSEPVVINCVNRPELQEAFGHLNNIIILNTFDDTLPRMGGASLA